MRLLADGTLDDAIEGTSGDDAVHGTAGPDRLVGYAGADALWGDGGDDRLEGGNGVDTAHYSGAYAGYTVAAQGDAPTVRDRTAGRDGMDILRDVERLEFSDKHVAVDINGHGGQAYRLYVAAFGRTPDLGGLGFHIASLDAGVSLTDVAGGFLASTEFVTKYGSLSDEDYVTQLYGNVLHREPDTDGLIYHVGRLSSGATRADLLVGFSESAENQAGVIGTIGAGIEYVPYV